MTATFWTGSSLSFTNGSKIVTVNTGPSLDSVKANSSLTAGSYNEPVEVKSVSGNTITLYNNWPGSTGTTSATIKPSAAAAASAGVAAQQLITDIQSLVSSASATATANSFVKRDSNGRIKSASPSANDDVVTKGYLGSAATRNVGTEATNLMEVGAFGWGTIAQTKYPSTTIDDNTVPSGCYRVDNTLDGTFPSLASNFGTVTVSRLNGTQSGQFFMDAFGNTATRFYNNATGSFGEWYTTFHSANTNFNKFGGLTNNDLIGMFIATSSTEGRLYLPINSVTGASSMTVTGAFKLSDPGGADVVNNIPNSSIVFNSVSSGKMVRVVITGLSGVFSGQWYELRTIDANSKITINF